MIPLSPAMRKAVRVLISAGIVYAIALFYSRIMPSNNETIALTVLLAVLGISTAWGLTEAITASILAVILFNYYFLPPLGWNLGGQRDWMALAAFLITAVTASELSARARRRATEALERRREVEKLHLLAQAMLLKGEVRETAMETVDRIVQIFEIRAAVFFSKAENTIFRSGPDIPAISDQQLRDAAEGDDAVLNLLKQVALVPVRLAKQTIGSLGLEGPPSQKLP